MEEETNVYINPAHKCEVCGEQNFALRDGYYYCEECGTQQAQFQATYNEAPDGPVAHTKKIKIKQPKVSAPELTSWECYNYMLLGLVEDLLQFGAKEELKQMTLQVWTAYLRYKEVAFFNKSKPDLPKLCERYIHRDARVLYNHTKKAKKRSRRYISSASSRSSARKWANSKRRLDETQYSMKTNDSEEQNDSISTSGTSEASSKRAIRLNFSKSARKVLKKTMPAKHIKKHEMDFGNNLECHKRPNIRSLKREDKIMSKLNPKQLYAFVGIALNLIGDNIQLCDLLRFIREGHLSLKNPTKYFPPNIHPFLFSLLKELEYGTCSQKFSYEALATQINYTRKSLHIRAYRKPDLVKLTARYVTELQLPEDVAVMARRLINFFPPQMKKTKKYPVYEARAMAYIVFVLKLLLGLDGCKEQRISDSAAAINQRLLEHKKNNRYATESQHLPAQLFVWNEWQQYVEMRKVILARYNPLSSQQFEERQSMEQLLQQITEEQQHLEPLQKSNDKVPQIVEKMKNMRVLFKKFEQECGQAAAAQRPVFIFPPNLTPTHSYFKEIHKSAADDVPNNIDMPAYMATNHNSRSLRYMLQPKQLQRYFAEHNLRLRLVREACTQNRNYVGNFSSNFESNTQLGYIKADFNISDSEWLEKVKILPCKSILTFVREPKMTKRPKKLPKMTETPIFPVKLPMDGRYSLHSFDIFTEGDMEPLDNEELNMPRNMPNDCNMFEDLSSDEEKEEAAANKNNENETANLELIISNLDYWSLQGPIRSLNDKVLEKLKRKLPRPLVWLLNTCAQTIEVDWIYIYEQLSILETVFLYGMESLNNKPQCIRLIDQTGQKDIDRFLKVSRELW